MFLLFEFIFAYFGIMSLIARYTLISYAVIVIVCGYGFSVFKLKKLVCILFTIFISSFLFFAFSKDYNAIKKQILFGSPVKKMFDNFQIRKSDYILIPMMGKLYKRYLPENASYIDFEVTDMLLNDVRKYFPIVFDEETTQKLNRKNARTILKEYIISEKLNENLENRLKTQYFDKMTNGQAFIVIVYDINTVNDINKIYEKPYKERDEIYNNGSFYYMLSSKITFDIIQASNKHLTLLKSFIIKDKKGPENNTGVFIYMKTQN